MNIYDKIDAVREDKNFVAIKVWTTDDIASALECNGITPTESNITEVINRLNMSVFEDCTDREWNEIYEAISLSAGKFE